MSAQLIDGAVQALFPPALRSNSSPAAP
jgi:hypothetical protein